MTEAFLNALAKLEEALAGALERVTEIGTPEDIERLVSLYIKKKIVTEMLLETIQSIASADSGQTADPQPPNELLIPAEDAALNHNEDGEAQPEND